MAGFLEKLKEKFAISPSSHAKDEAPEGEQYVELGSAHSSEARGDVIVRPYVIQEFEHIKPVLDDLREGNTIALLNIKPLRDKDLVELKRAINKLKKTTDALAGDIAGFGDDWIAVTPSFAKIYRAQKKGVGKEEKVSEVSEYDDE
ncbi:TPA: cell division protein SepF [Candidatus Woesearchaeota archaeon]|nr:cell division protein SepF [Candidatus Woesearchaeota archaeon]